MKKFKITVNGKSYEVEVEEVGGAAPAAPVQSPAPAVGGPIPEGAITVKAPMPGKISALKVEEGTDVKRGDVLLVLEAMKMQNDITATADGKLHEMRVKVGDNVKTGDVLAVIMA